MVLRKIIEKIKSPFTSEKKTVSVPQVKWYLVDIPDEATELGLESPKMLHEMRGMEEVDKEILGAPEPKIRRLRRSGKIVIDYSDQRVEEMERVPRAKIMSRLQTKKFLSGMEIIKEEEGKG